MQRFASCFSFAIVIAAVIFSPTYGASPEFTNFEATLLPSPVSDLTASSVAGTGRATATLDNNRLTISGNFGGLASSATDAHLFMGTAIGVPGKSILDLTISQTTSGVISGQFNLTRTQITALRRGHIYVQINSQKMTTPYGTLWGWLLPNHQAVIQDAPEQGHWFLPQYDVPQSN